VVEVRARRADGNSSYEVGMVTIEDLDPVLSRIANRSGPRGPNGAMTQWILGQAALHLGEQLAGGLSGTSSDESLPQVLSRLVGHEPFATNVLRLSVHQVTRRWSTASDWYGDLLAYVLRPARITQHAQLMAEHLTSLGAVPFGEEARLLGRRVLDVAADPSLYRLADLIEALWPEHPLVVDATIRSRRLMESEWSSIYQGIFDAYGLVLRDELTMSDVVWTLQALTAWDIREQRVTPDLVGVVDRLDGRRWTRSGRSALVFLAGALQTADGRSLTHEELVARPPVR
jgi:hypothetical protein